MSKTKWGRRHDTNQPYPKGIIPIPNKGEYDVVEPPTKLKREKEGECSQSGTVRVHKETKKEKLNRLMVKYGVKEVATTERCVISSKACSPVKYSLEGVSTVICEKHLPDILVRLDRTDWISKVGPKMEK